MAEPFRIQLLGGFQLTHQGDPILAAEPASARALVARLLLPPGTAQPRQQLAFQLWPDSAEPQALSNLRALLVRLRRAWPTMPEYVEIGPRTLRWRDTAAVWCDAAEFERALQRAGQAPAQRRAALEQAVELYRGDLFPGCYQDWILPERERLRQSYLQALEALIELLGAAGHASAAIGYAQRRLNADPLDEASYQALMQLHAQRGDRAGVLRVFETCATTLQRELALDPSASTRTLFEALLREPPARPRPSHLPLIPQHNLSYPLTSFVGRERELLEVTHRLKAARLLTLTGAGGSGKTRLALHVAFVVLSAYPDGVWWVDLAPLSDPDLIARAVASSLGAQEQPGRPLSITIADAVGLRALLLVLDNCEHLATECAPLVHRWLSECPNLTILATSREALGLTGEAIYPVAPLSLPAESDSADGEEADAVRLFVERAALVLPTFALTARNRPAVVQICRRLDGIPLAIELAAARVKVMPVEQIAARLDDRFSLLISPDRAVLPRHQTLRAMVDWSHGLLAEPEQSLLRRLAIFTGGFTLEAAEAVAGSLADPAVPVLEVLSRLIDKSLIIAETASGEVARYRLLETLHQYALEKLESANELLGLRQRHAEYFARRAAEIGLRPQTITHLEWVRALAAEQANLQATLHWWVSSGQTEAALRFVNALGWYWIMRSAYSEGRRWLERSLALSDASQFPGAYGRALAFNGMIAFLQTEASEAQPWLEKALAVAREQGDNLTMADALDFLGLVWLWRRVLPRARACFEESQQLFQAQANRWGEARLRWHLGLLTEREGDTVSALKQYEEAVELFSKLDDPLRVAPVLRSLGWTYYELGDRQRGRQAYRALLDRSQAFGNRAEIAHTLRAVAERIEADPARAVRLLMVVHSLYAALGSTTYAQAVLEKDLAQRRAQLDEHSFAAACQAGRSWTWEQAVQDALLVEA
jgi:predicted ATPase/DNA-binding SARP family transcriptional activator